MIGEFSRVYVVNNPNRILNDSMLDWISEHAGVVFKVERVVGDSVKLFKVNFWVSNDLLVEA